MVNAFRAGTIVAVVAGVVGWFMVLRRQSFAGHTLAVVGFPGRRRRGAARRQRDATGCFAFCLARRAASSRAVPGGRRPRLQRGVGGHRHRAGVRAGLRLPVRQRCTAASSAAPTRCCSAASSASPPARSLLLAGRRPSVALAVLAVIAPAAAVRLRRPRRRRGPRRAGARRCRSRSWSCSASPPPRPARSPARCWCSRCWCVPAATAQAGHRPARRSALALAVGIGRRRHLARRWSSPTTRRTRSGSGSRRSRSRVYLLARRRPAARPTARRGAGA